MVFSSMIFLWLFFPVVFVVNYFLQPKYSNLFLLMASLVFYAWGEPHLVLLMILSVVINWLIGKGLCNFEKQKKIILIIGIALNLGVLGYYKYAGFGVEIINLLAGRELFAIPKIRLPIGISFFTFQAISYIIDVYRGEMTENCSGGEKLINVALYISFFPQLIAGPIVKYKNINKQIECRTLSKENVAFGFRRFVYGLSKKVLISNILGKSADTIFAMDVTSISGGMAWIAALFYTLQIYYDFSGYSDMAIGLGKMFGFDIPENFNYPYTSISIREFWRRWHISLSSWFKDYVYVPLGGNRKGEFRTYLNLFTVFLLTGLWHGASFAFIVWGLYHGILSILERIGLEKILSKSRLIAHIYVFVAVNFGWVIFRISELKDAIFFIKRMVMPWLYVDYDISSRMYTNNLTVFIFICALLGMGPIQYFVSDKIKERWKFSHMELVYCIVMCFLCIISIASNTYNPFIYFQF